MPKLNNTRSDTWQDSSVSPSIEEQDIVKKYVLEHPLSRPNTNIRTAVFGFVIFEIATTTLTTLLFYLLTKVYDRCSYVTWEVIWLSTHILLVLIFIKKISVIIIKLYQHYAPEEIRRRCCLMPTCSEYALLAINKYGAYKGLYKTYVRLRKRCNGELYYIDNP